MDIEQPYKISEKKGTFTISGPGIGDVSFFGTGPGTIKISRERAEVLVEQLNSAFNEGYAQCFGEWNG